MLVKRRDLDPLEGVGVAWLRGSIWPRPKSVGVLPVLLSRPASDLSHLSICVTRGQWQPIYDRDDCGLIRAPSLTLGPQLQPRRVVVVPCTAVLRLHGGFRLLHTFIPANRHHHGRQARHVTQRLVRSPGLSLAAAAPIRIG